MREWLITFLKRLEELIPPAAGSHHPILYAKYGSDVTNWVDRLAVQVGINGRFHCLFLDDADFTKNPHELALEIKQELDLGPLRNEQLSDTPCQFKL